MVYYDRQWGCSMSKCHEPCVHADVITESSDCSLFTISYFLFIVFFSSKMHKRVLQSHIYYLDRFDMPFHIVFAWPSSLLVFLKMDTDILCCLLFRFGESRWCSGRFFEHVHSHGLAYFRPIVIMPTYTQQHEECMLLEISVFVLMTSTGRLIPQGNLGWVLRRAIDNKKQHH